MTPVYNLEQIKKKIDPGELIRSQEEGFVAYSEGRVVVPPVGYLHFPDAPGDCHIKYGFIKDDEYFVVKVATGFYENPQIGLPAGNGMMALFSQKTGSPAAILLDEGYLTDIRTAAAGAVAAKYLAPTNVERIGIVGTGVQARLQLMMLRHVTSCRDVFVWGRNEAKAKLYSTEMVEQGFDVEVASRIDDVAAGCNLIVSTTPAREPLLYARQIRPGTHVTAVGADAPGKQELDAELFRKADVRAVDSLSQCIDHGDASHAVKAGYVEGSQLVELGAVIKRPELGRTDDGQITIADLTGVAVQDVQVAKLAFASLRHQHASN